MRVDIEKFVGLLAVIAGGVIEAASAGNPPAAGQAFSCANSGEIHSFTHNMDAPLREVGGT